MTAIQAAATGDVAQIARSVEQVPRPSWVRGVEVVRGVDAAGEDSLWIWILLDDADVPERELRQGLGELRVRLREELDRVAPGVWAYIRVRESGEHEGTDG